ALFGQGKVAEAVKVAREASALARDSLGIRSTEFLYVHSHLGQFLSAAGQFDEAEAVCWELVEVWRQTGEEGRATLAQCENNLAEVYRQTDRHAKAVPLYRRALEVMRQAHGERSALVAILLNNLALSLVATGCHDEAEPLFRESLEIRLEVFGG